PVGRQPAAPHGTEVRELRQGHVDLEGRARVVDVLDAGEKLGRQLPLLQELQERDVGIDVRDHLARVEFSAVLERHALRPAAARPSRASGTATRARRAAPGSRAGTTRGWEGSGAAWAR